MHERDQSLQPGDLYVLSAMMVVVLFRLRILNADKALYLDAMMATRVEIVRDDYEF